MRPKSGTPETPSERLVRDIRRPRRKQYSAKKKIRVVLDERRSKVTVAVLCRVFAERRLHRREPLLQLVEGVAESRQAQSLPTRRVLAPAARQRSLSAKLGN